MHSPVWLPVLGDGVYEHAQYHHAHGTRPAAQHGLLPDGHVCADGSIEPNLQRLRRCRFAAKDAQARAAAAVQSAGRFLCRSLNDVPQRQARHHFRGKEPAVRPLLQALPVHQPCELRRQLRHGLACHHLHDGARLLHGTDLRPRRSHHRQHHRYEAHAAACAQGMSAVHDRKRDRG